MAIYRKIHVQFWGDVFIQTLTPEQKFFFLYLLTNERTKQCGIYEITTRQISFDTGYTVETVLRLIEFFTNAGKMVFSRETNEMAIKNWDRYNKSDSPSVKGLVKQELSDVKNKKLIEWVQSGGTVLPHNKKVAGVEVEVVPEEEPAQEPEREGHPNLIYDGEKELLKNQIQFEKICMAAKALDPESAKESLRKFHLHLEEKARYPQTRKQIFSGFEKWLLNEKKFNNGTHKQNNSNGAAKLGTSDARTEALRKW
jgi:hypothetical protein